jgi:hypothetical protein
MRVKRRRGQIGRHCQHPHLLDYALRLVGLVADRRLDCEHRFYRREVRGSSPNSKKKP